MPRPKPKSDQHAPDSAAQTSVKTEGHSGHSRTPALGVSPSRALRRELPMKGSRIRDARRLRADAAGAVVGVDSGKFKHALSIRTKGGHDSKPFEFPVTRSGFEEAVARITKLTGELPADEVLVGIEFAGTCGFTFAHYLDQLGYPVVSILPRSTKRWKDVVHRGPNKTDPLDALTIVDLAARGDFVGFPFLDPGYADLRHLTSAFTRITRERTGVATRLHWALHTVFPEFTGLAGDLLKTKAPLAILAEFPGPEAILSASRDDLLAVVKHYYRGTKGEQFSDALRRAAEGTLALPSSQGALATEVPLLAERIQLLSRQRQEVEQAMIACAATLPETEFLLSVPMVGDVTVAVFLGSIGDPQSYTSVNAVMAHAGLSLITTRSGTQNAPYRISRSGRSLLRHHLYLLAMRHLAAENGGLLRDKYDELRKRKDNHNWAQVALMRTLLRVLFAVAKNRTPFDAALLRPIASRNVVA